MRTKDGLSVQGNTMTFGLAAEVAWRRAVSGRRTVLLHHLRIPVAAFADGTSSADQCPMHHTEEVVVLGRCTEDRDAPGSKVSFGPSRQ